LQQKYFSEYVAEWRQFLRETSVTKLNSKDDVREALKVMSGANSPVALVVNRVATETDFGRANRGGGFFGWIKGLFSGSRNENGGARTIVEREFGPLIRFTTPDGEKGEAAIVQYRNDLQSLRDQLDSGSGDQLAQTSKALLTNQEEPAFQKAEQDVGRLLESLNTPASRDAGALLKQPLRSIRAMQTAGTFDQISQMWRNQIYPKAKALESGYPFTDAGEASVEDLARFLNPVDGELWTFFNGHITNAFQDVQGRWKLLDSGAFDFSPEFVDYLNNARQLRDALFAGDSKQLSVNYDLSVQPSGADVDLNIDGNPPVQIRGNTPGSVTLKWPAQVGDVGGKITVTQAGRPPAVRVFPGKWGLYKMIQEGGGAGQVDASQYALNWSVGSTSVRATLRPASTKSNPFQINLFRSLHAPPDLKH
ncbi:MAG: type VI secretion IcmF C-terminal domain-containing protein, partial [Blastocatellia bacterium]